MNATIAILIIAIAIYLLWMDKGGEVEKKEEKEESDADAPRANERKKPLFEWAPPRVSIITQQELSGIIGKEEIRGFQHALISHYTTLITLVFYREGAFHVVRLAQEVDDQNDLDGWLETTVHEGETALAAFRRIGLFGLYVEILEESYSRGYQHIRRYFPLALPAGNQ